MKRNLWPVFIPLATLVVLIALLAAVIKTGTGTFASHVGDPAPATELSAPGGGWKVFASADWRGRPYVVNFFASWCAPCQAEHPLLMMIAAQRVPVIGIAVKDRPQATAAFLAKDGNPYAVLADDSAGRTGIDWGITGVPETFLIDAAGVIRFHAAGPLTEDVVMHQLLPLWHKLQP